METRPVSCNPFESTKRGVETIWLARRDKIAAPVQLLVPEPPKSAYGGSTVAGNFTGLDHNTINAFGADFVDYKAELSASLEESPIASPDRDQMSAENHRESEDNFGAPLGSTSALINHNIPYNKEMFLNEAWPDMVSQPPAVSVRRSPQRSPCSSKSISPTRFASSSSLNSIAQMEEGNLAEPEGRTTTLLPESRSTASGSLNSHESLTASTQGTFGPTSIEKRISQFDLASTAVIPHLGSSAASLMPRIKTIELYRKNARKTNDPQVEYHLAHYMVQTALLGNQDTNIDAVSFSSSSKSLSTSASDKGTRSSKSSKNMSQEESETKLKQNLLKEAVALLKRLAERGYTDAQYLLGDLYSSPAVHGKRDLRQSFQYFLMAAKHNHPEAAYRAALCLQEGWGTPRDASRALEFYKVAAARNQPGALFMLGIAYFYGRLGLTDTPVNRQNGFKWLTRAVNAATVVYNKAPYALAKIYEVGYKDIVFPDIAYALRLYVRSAELEYIPAIVELGQAYEYGRLGCPQDAALSIHYYTIAAVAGDPVAELGLCAWYMVGAGPHFSQNENEAFEWAYRAAKHGLPKAMYTVGSFLEKGIGCDRDILKATRWFRRAARCGDEAAIRRLRYGKPDGSEIDKKKCVVM